MKASELIQLLEMNPDDEVQIYWQTRHVPVVTVRSKFLMVKSENGYEIKPISDGQVIAKMKILMNLLSMDDEEATRNCEWEFPTNATKAMLLRVHRNRIRDLQDFIRAFDDTPYTTMVVPSI